MILATKYRVTRIRSTDPTCQATWRAQGRMFESNSKVEIKSELNGGRELDGRGIWKGNRSGDSKWGMGKPEKENRNLWVRTAL